MRQLLLLLIRCYWHLVPADRRRRCLFRVSCSAHVHAVTKSGGLMRGLIALRYRQRRCNGGYRLLEDPVSGEKELLLRTGERLTEWEMALRFLANGS